jgi:hypothetical protein
MHLPARLRTDEGSFSSIHAVIRFRCRVAENVRWQLDASRWTKRRPSHQIAISLMVARTQCESNMEIQIENGYRHFEGGFSYGLHEE